MNRYVKKAIITIIILSFVALMPSCSCNHEWNPATCTAPKTCTKCGVTEGEALGHNFGVATCTSPATCAKCGAINGTALGHNNNEATCTSPATCSRCRATTGNALGHTVGIGICSRCGNYSYILMSQANSIDKKFSDFIKETEKAYQGLLDSYKFVTDNYQQVYIAQAFADFTVNACNRLSDIADILAEIDKIGSYPELNDFKNEIKDLLIIEQDVVNYWNTTYDIYGTRTYMSERLADINYHIDNVNNIIKSWKL